MRTFSLYRILWIKATHILNSNTKRGIPYCNFILYPLYSSLSCAKSHTVGTVRPRFIYLIAGTSDDWNRGFDILTTVPALSGRMIPDTNQRSIHTQKRGTSQLGLAKVPWYPLYRLNGVPRAQFKLPSGYSVAIGGRRV